MSALQELVYVSRPRVQPHTPECLDILRACLRNNGPRGLTGFLFFDRIAFAQVLEGPGAALARMVAALRADPRHADMRICRQGPIAARRFAGWDMAMADGTAQAPLFGFAPPRAVLERAQAGDAAPLLALLDALSPTGRRG